MFHHRYGKKIDQVGFRDLDLDVVKQMDRDHFFKLDPTLKDVWRGHEYRDGSATTKQDYSEAAKCYSKAASEGSLEAKYNLACLYQEGKEVKQDYDLAYSFLKQAVEKENLEEIEIDDISKKINIW